MKIVFSCIGKEMSDVLDPRFGRCGFFVFYDEETGEVAFVENKGQYAGGGAGIAAAQQVIDKSADVVITGNMGPNAFDLIKNSGIKVYQGIHGTCSENLSHYKKGELNELKEAGPPHRGKGRGRGF